MRNLIGDLLDAGRTDSGTLSVAPQALGGGRPRGAGAKHVPERRRPPRRRRRPAGTLPAASEPPRASSWWTTTRGRYASSATRSPRPATPRS